MQHNDFSIIKARQSIPKSEMNALSKLSDKLPPEQEVSRASCFHPTGEFVEFPVEDLKTSIQQRYEKIACQYPDRSAVKMGNRAPVVVS